MTTVTVDLADLEALVFSVGAMKSIEGILATRKNDPFVRPHLDITLAHNRLAVEVRNAKRAEAGTATSWNEPATGEEQLWLACFEDGYGNPVQIIFVDANKRNAAIDRLASKGMVIVGHVAEAYVWSGEDRPELKLYPAKYVLKITPRGIAERARFIEQGRQAAAFAEREP